MTDRIIDDKRPISHIMFPDGSRVMAGSNGVEGIIPYEENGQMASVVWFKAIGFSGEVLSCHNGAMVESVFYMTREEE